MYDILIIGGGPAGVSAALTAHSRGRTPWSSATPSRATPWHGPNGSAITPVCPM